ncbi:MYND finger protein [Apiospora rasikravindrae]|uniref:MYND finger protein n=1 Tax=Apiospora rasikravindrae TaxID=990691 RepID=A0ABR1SL38_9PEZI
MPHLSTWANHFSLPQRNPRAWLSHTPDPIGRASPRLLPPSRISGGHHKASLTTRQDACEYKRTLVAEARVEPKPRDGRAVLLALTLAMLAGKECCDDGARMHRVPDALRGSLLTVSARSEVITHIAATLGWTWDRRPRLCTGCKAIAYCGVACQKADWARVHKEEYKVFRRVQTAAAGRPLPTPVPALVQILLLTEKLESSTGLRLENRVEDFRRHSNGRRRRAQAARGAVVSGSGTAGHPRVGLVAWLRIRNTLRHFTATSRLEEAGMVRIDYTGQTQPFFHDTVYEHPVIFKPVLL